MMSMDSAPLILQRRLIAWYRKNARGNLPWRKTKDPYRIWVSEAMLQQTQVATVVPYYERFLQRFPTVKDLARAPLASVLDCWSGLGYYSRARNLHQAAQRIWKERKGMIPDRVDALLELPGIGRYTAGAIASIAYDRPAPILDANATRVLSRLFGRKADPHTAQGQKGLWELSEGLLPKEDPGIFNQALMELGELLCKPKNPLCGLCPLRRSCKAFHLGIQDQIPPPRLASFRKKIRYVCGILKRKDAFLLARRPFFGLLSGLWEFPGGELIPGESEEGSLIRQLKNRLDIEAKPLRLCAQITQTLSHRVLHIRAFWCRFQGSPQAHWYLETRWVGKRTLKGFPLTAGMRRIAQGLLRVAILAPLGLFLLGCATVGPRIDRQELQSAYEFYEVKAKRHTYSQLTRVRTVGERLLAVVPQELRPKNPKPSLGIFLDELNLVSGRVFGIPSIEPDPQAKEKTPWKKKKACLIAGVLPDSPASLAGLQAGDLLLKVGSKETPTPGKAIQALEKIKPGTQVSLLLEREGVRFEKKLIAEEKPYPVSFNIAEEEEVNAFASPGQIVVTTSLLRFVSSEDELAVVLAHELAHLTRGHYAKRMGTDVLAGAIGMITGVAIDIVVPGAGGVIGRVTSAGIRAPFSQDFEREADYVGLRYAHQAGYRIEEGVTFWDRFATELPKSLSRSFFNTHPTSPERLLRLQKTIEEIKGP